MKLKAIKAAFLFLMLCFTSSVIFAVDLPANLVATANGPYAIDLTWDAADDEGYYVVEYNSGGDWIAIANQYLPTSFTHEGLSCNATYEYRVTFALTGGLFGGMSAVVSATTDACPVSPIPTNVSAVANGNVVTVTWDDVLDETHYIVERSEDTINWVNVGNLPADTTEYIDNAVCGKTYYYQVASFTNSANLGFSSTVSATTDACPQPPTTPTNVNAVANGNDVTITWDDSLNETGYDIQRWETIEDEEVNFVVLAQNLPADSTQYVDNAACGTTYNYVVVSYSSLTGTYSDLSSTVSATTAACPLPPAAPANVAVQLVNGDQAKVTWADVEGETGYTLKSDSVGWLIDIDPDVTEYIVSVANFCGGLQIDFAVRAFNSAGSSDYSEMVYIASPPCPRGNQLFNTDFDDAGSTAAIPAKWRRISTESKDRRVCVPGDEEGELNCHFRFVGSADGMDILRQTLNLTNTPTLSELGEGATISIRAGGKRVSTNKPVVIELLVIYEDNSSEYIGKTLSAGTDDGFRRLGTDEVRLDNPVKSIVVTVKYQGTAGRFLLDYVRLSID